MSDDVAGDGAGVQNRVRAVRTRLGLSQQELARAAGVTRQAIGGVEAGRYAPTAAVALRLARALGCRVEELFWLEEEAASVDASVFGGGELPEGGRCALARVGGGWVAFPLAGDAAFRTEMVPADGVAVPADGKPAVRLLEAPDALARTAVVAGCAPALSLWARSAERRHPGLRVHWFEANSRDALGALLDGKVHAAGVHVRDSATGESNAPFVRRALADRGDSTPVVLVNVGEWEEGLLVAPGNPQGISGAGDLRRTGITLVNREPGAGARRLLDDELAAAGVAPPEVAGYDTVVHGHAAIARAVASGAADAGVSTAAIAAAYVLGFVPLRSVRYDLAFRKAGLSEEPVQQLLDALGTRWVRAQLAAAGGFDTSRTGEVVAEVAASG